MTTRSPEPANDGLNLSGEVRWYLESRHIPLPDCPPRIKTPEPGNVAGARFDPARVDRVLQVFGLLRHTQGQWAGRPLHPAPWQVAYVLAPTFGWVRKNDAGQWVRIIRSLYVELPRKNGKTTSAGGIATYLMAADGEAGAQVYAVATAKDQARYCFDPVRAIAEKSPALKPYVKAMASRIVHVPSGSYFAVASRAADLLHGANVHGAVIDELHAHTTPDLVETVESGTGSRLQPLVVIITTADAGKRETIYDRRRTYVEQLARGALTDETHYGVVWCATEDDDPFAESTWKAANPGYGVSPTRAYLKAASAKAQNSPAELSAYLRLHLGIRTRQLTRYIELHSWDTNASMVDPRKLAGRDAYGGLDLAAVSDLTALCWLFPDDAGGYDAVWRLWTPERNLPKLDQRTAGAATAWTRSGVLSVTPGNVIDYDFIRAQIDADRDTFKVKSIGYDPWNASQITNDLVNAGAPMVKVRQGFITLSPPLKEIQRLLLTGTTDKPLLRHGGNPAVRWMVDNLAVAMDPAGNVKPDKANGADKIDAVSALVTAMSEAMTRPKPGSRRAVGV